MLLTSELQGEVQEILETMTEDYRHILLLKYEYELSYKEIAILLSMKEETVKTSLYCARNQFKNCIGGETMSRKDFDLNMDDKQMKTLLKRAKRKQFLEILSSQFCIYFSDY